VQLPYHNLFSGPSLSEDAENVKNILKRLQGEGDRRVEAVPKKPTNPQLDA
jgi:hypothetical protein